MAAIEQVGPHPAIPSPDSIDVVQMLRNLAAASIGKEWVSRNPDGTFSLTERGKQVGVTGEILRPRGRRPAEGDKKNEDGGEGGNSRGRARKTAGTPEKGESKRSGKRRRQG
jgi:hypothetical protein